MSIINITLIIATKDRVEVIKRCLSSIDPQEMLAVGCEVVVVDNGSADNTLRYLEAFRDSAQFPVKVVCETQRGLSYARNAGMRVSEGDFIVMTDDDCYPEKGYFVKVFAAFRKADFQYGGGRVLLFDAADALRGASHRTEPLCILPRSYVPAGTLTGCNMVFHRRVLDVVGFFDTLLGAGSPLSSGEDSDYVARASLAGFTGAFLPELVIYHHHGRKKGSRQEREIIEKYALGRGAFEIKAVIRGQKIYLKSIIKRFLDYVRNKNRRMLLLELRGMLLYIYLRVIKVFSRKKSAVSMKNRTYSKQAD